MADFPMRVPVVKPIAGVWIQTYAAYCHDPVYGASIEDRGVIASPTGAVEAFPVKAIVIDPGALAGLPFPFEPQPGERIERS